MAKRLAFACLLLLSACVSVSVETPPPATVSGFVTSTLPPTKEKYIPATLTPTPNATATPKVEITVPADCKDGAVLLRDVTIPDGTRMKAGETFVKTWELLNAGGCPWLNYEVKFAAGDSMSAPLSAPVPLTLPGEKVQISVELTAPSAPGNYAAYFTLNNAQGKDLFIGAEKVFWVKIQVGE